MNRRALCVIKLGQEGANPLQQTIAVQNRVLLFSGKTETIPKMFKKNKNKKNMTTTLQVSTKTRAHPPCEV